MKRTNKANALKKKPDFETDKFRAWKPENYGVEDLKSLDDGDIKIKFKGMELGLSGFNKCLDKKTKALVMAYKFKHEQKLVIYYVPVITYEAEDMLEGLGEACGILGYKLMNALDTLADIYNHRKDLDKMSGKKGVKNKENKNG